VGEFMEYNPYTLHKEITLFQTTSHFILRPEGRQGKELPSLVINRRYHPQTHGLELQQCPTSTIEGQEESFPIYGCIGIITLLQGPYLLVIKERALVGSVENCAIYKILKIGLVPFCADVASLSKKQLKMEQTYRKILKQLIQAGDFYFSYDYDLTNSLQRKFKQGLSQASLWQRVDDRFFWNFFLVQPFIADGGQLDAWILPIMRGCIQIFLFMLQDKSFEFILISRRSRYRAGTRYITRGADEEGKVANYVETEQIVNLGSHWASFVQTRGSVPLLWEQRGSAFPPFLLSPPSSPG